MQKKYLSGTLFRDANNFFYLALKKELLMLVQKNLETRFITTDAFIGDTIISGKEIEKRDGLGCTEAGASF